MTEGKIRAAISRAFRDAYGIDPSKFRKKLGDAAMDAPQPLSGSRDRFGLSSEPRSEAVAEPHR
jgi:hypothetical protein